MAFELWSLYIITVFVVLLSPGPSHLLMLANAISYGYQRAVFTAIGDLSANLIQIAIAGLGLATLITQSAHALNIIKWLGVAYLIRLGISRVRMREKNTGSNQSPSGDISVKTLFLQGFMTSAVNPKAIIFFAALLPQFIVPDTPLARQLFILALSYIAIDGFFLCAYGLSAAYITRHFNRRAKAGLIRIGGVLMILTALLLALKTGSGY